MRSARAFAAGIVAMLVASGPCAAQPAAVPAAAPTAALIKLKTGVSLEYVAQGDPRGPAIVLLHGVGDSWHSWDRVMPRLPLRYHVFALTQRGHGFSDHPASGYTRRDFAADVLAFLGQLDITHATLVGHSLGSLVAQAVVEQDSSRIDRLVLIGSGPGTMRDRETRSEIGGMFAKLTDPIDVSFARDLQLGTIYHPVPATYVDLMIGEAMKVPARAWQGVAGFLNDSQPADALSRITVPTSIFWGDKDTAFSRADQDALVAGIPQARLHIYPDTGHALHWERPEAFVRDLLRDMR